MHNIGEIHAQLSIRAVRRGVKSAVRGFGWCTLSVADYAVDMVRLVLLADAGVAHVVALGVGRPCVRHGQIAGAQQCRPAGFIGCEYIEVGMAMMLIRIPAGDDPTRPGWLTGLVL